MNIRETKIYSGLYQNTHLYLLIKHLRACVDNFFGTLFFARDIPTGGKQATCQYNGALYNPDHSPRFCPVLLRTGCSIFL